MRTLNVLSVAYPFAPVTPDTAGGAEQVLARIDAALTRAGHHSLVIAREGSKIAGQLIATPVGDGVIDPAQRERGWAAHRAAITHALESYSIDVVHLHGCDFDHYLPPPGKPALITVHLPRSFYSEGAFPVKRPGTWMHCVSMTQQREWPESRALGGMFFPVIENGVPDCLFSIQTRQREFCAALGRICPEKGFHLALDAAKAVQKPLLLAGETFQYPEHLRYFECEIAPRLDGERRWIGRVGIRRKSRLLCAAQCLLAPSLAAETSSLVAMEALMCGTPVVAFSNGALPEIVEDGVTGFLVRDVREMAEAIPATRGLNRAECRRIALERFSFERTAARYLDMYNWLARV